MLIHSDKLSRIRIISHDFFDDSALTPYDLPRIAYAFIMTESQKPQLYYLPEGAEVYIGRPSIPLPADRVIYITELTLDIPELREAHLPQLFVPGVMDQPSQVLVIRTDANTSELMEAIIKLQEKPIEKTGIRLDVLPLSKGSPLWNDIRDQNLSIVAL